MKGLYYFTVLLAIWKLSLFANALETGEEHSTQQVHSAKPNFPFGDYRNCVLNGITLPRLETLPGLGWDNLINRVSGIVALYNYSLCRTTEDGLYLIPNDVFVIPIKESKASLFSELIDHWTKFTSTTSKTINVEAHESFFGSISGSFSSEYSDVKKHQVSSFALSKMLWADIHDVLQPLDIFFTKTAGAFGRASVMSKRAQAQREIQ